jgi:DNA mismatch endonuclease (patch repair protein)
MPSKSPSYKGLQPASEAASRAMRSNRKKDTRHELLLRAVLWRKGLRYRKHVAVIPGKPDLVFTRSKVVVFCDGDFWHGRGWKRLKRQLEQRHNAAYWIAKIAANRRRDLENNARLTRAGWHVIRLWETDINTDPERAALKVLKAIASRRKRHIASGPCRTRHYVRE